MENLGSFLEPRSTNTMYGYGTWVCGVHTYPSITLESTVRHDSNGLKSMERLDSEISPRILTIGNFSMKLNCRSPSKDLCMQCPVVQLNSVPCKRHRLLVKAIELLGPMQKCKGGHFGRYFHPTATCYVAYTPIVCWQKA